MSRLFGTEQFGRSPAVPDGLLPVNGPPVKVSVGVPGDSVPLEGVAAMARPHASARNVAANAAACRTLIIALLLQSRWMGADFRKAGRAFLWGTPIAEFRGRRT